MVMFDSTRDLRSRWPVASALVGVLAWALLLLLPTSETTAARTNISGPARVIDGDTLEVAGERVRLEGIDAPEMAQTCGKRLWGSWSCGKAAAAALEHLLGNQRIACEDRGTDNYGRMLGVCFLDKRDINAWMVREGLAWAFVKYSRSYVSEEAAARAQHIGIWQGKAQPAWLFRAERWEGAKDVAPKGCAIKGNISANGHIYHLPWSPWYSKVRIDERRGERWFCSEAEALAAGWRPAAAR